MPINYWVILKRTFHVTVRFPGLWLLGLFLSGGFNANIFYWANLRLTWREHGQTLFGWLQANVQYGHHWLAALGLGVVVVGIIVVVTNWAKTAFVLYISDLLQMKRMRALPASPDITLSKSFQEGRRFLPDVISLSLFTMVSMIVLTTVLGGSSKILFASRGLVWLTAGVIFLGLVFVFSCLNIFGTFFIIFYQQRFSRALNLARDLIVSRWQNIIEMALILMIIYGLCFFVGSSLVFYGPPTVLGALILWLWLAIVNTFFNVALLLLFAQLVKPPYHPEFKSLLAETPNALPEPAAFLVDKTMN
jgi:hypothetical protein